MLLRVLACATLSLAPAQADYGVTFINYDGVVRVDCLEGKGTAFRVGKTHFYTAAHVSSMHLCFVGNKPISNVKIDGNTDFAEFDADLPGPRLKISCEGYHAGEWGWATGYALGAGFQTAMPEYETYVKNGNGMRMMIGPHAFIPGMSGGPVFNAAGEVVGTVNAYFQNTNISLSRDLRDTAPCHSS
jgi:hypothetical protein